MSCYSNDGFRAEGRGRSVYSPMMEVAGFQADNETYVDDEVFLDSYVDFQKDDYTPACRRNIILPQVRRYSYASPSDRGGGLVVGYHHAHQLQSVAVNRGGDRWGLKQLDLRDTAVLAPIVASVQRDRRSHVHRSRSTLLSSPSKSQDRPIGESSNIRKSLPSLVAVRHYSPARLDGFERVAHLAETHRTPTKKPNTAVITPNIRGTPARGDGGTGFTPIKDFSPPPKSPSTFSKASWATLPTVHLPTETLCCVGFTLLLCGLTSISFCFYILSLTGKKYFIYFGASAGFTSLLLGLLNFRTNKWKWLPHRNYLTGYSLLAVFSILNTSCLGGICYALQHKNWPLVDTLGGGVCGMSLLVGAGCLLGLITSGCCHRPPPDNRVAHRVSGFTI